MKKTLILFSVLCLFHFPFDFLEDSAWGSTLSFDGMCGKDVQSQFPVTVKADDSAASVIGQYFTVYQVGKQVPTCVCQTVPTKFGGIISSFKASQDKQGNLLATGTVQAVLNNRVQVLSFTFTQVKGQVGTCQEVISNQFSLTSLYDSGIVPVVSGQLVILP